MRRIELFRAVFLRWESILSLTAIILPVIVSFLLGFFWMVEHGLLLHFIGASISLGALVALLRLTARRWQLRQSPVEDATELRTSGVDLSPEWGAEETALFEAARIEIRKRTAQPLPWAEIQTAALDIVNLVAQRSGRRTGLDFTVPEALLLIEQISAQFRADIRGMVPLSDTISISTILWVWRQKGWAMQTANLGQKAWRIVRVVKNPPAGILREVESALSGGHSSYLTGEAIAILQGTLLEEVAKAAVDLYSGRLSFSDAELLQIQMDGAEIDRARLAEPDSPLRIAVIGQVSAGKSTLINALVSADRAETDAAPTTVRGAAYEIELGDFECFVFDLPGLDGAQKTREGILEEMKLADIIIFVTRANRPAREIDRSILAEWDAWFQTVPKRRRPPLVAVASCIDLLVENWPFAEHGIPPAALENIASTVTSIGAAIGTKTPIPVAATSPEWNIDAVRKELIGVLGEALMVQRNRARLAGPKRGAGHEFGRAGRGISKGLEMLGRGIARRGVLDDLK